MTTAPPSPDVSGGQGTSLQGPRQWIALALCATVYIVSRLPLIYAGFGSDYDSLLYGQAGKHILETGVYEISRFPGFPLYEYLCALLLRFGDWRLINWVTSLLSLLSVVLFYCVMTTLGYSTTKKLLFSFFLALFPTFWISSATVMDYAWAFFFILASYLALCHKRWELSALCLATACGFRITSGVFIISFLYYLIRHKGIRIHLFLYVLIVGILLLVFYAPVLLRYGNDYLKHASYFETKIIYLRLYFLIYFVHRIVKFLGFFGSVFLAYCLVRSWHPFIQYLRSHDITARTHVLATGSLLLFFLIYPGQLGYLLPVVPFALLVLEAIVPFRRMIIMCALIVSSNVVDVSIFDSNERKPEFAIRKGAIFSDIEMRSRRLEYPHRLARVAFPNKSLVIIQGLPMAFGFDEQLFELVYRQVGEHRLPVGKRLGTSEDIFFLNAVALSVFPNAEELIDEFKRSGYTIYMQKEPYLTCKQVGDLFKVKLKDEWDIKVFELDKESLEINIRERGL